MLGRPSLAGPRSRLFLLVILSLSLYAHISFAANATPLAAAGALPAFPGLGDPGAAKSLELRSAGADAATVCQLVGPDARLQLLATATFANGQLRDWTGTVKYSVAPAGIVQIDAAGMVTATGDGTATITASGDGGLSATAQVKVERFSDPPPINFPNQVVPIFTKVGCNAGGCHGKSGGQNGFRLSLLGFEPTEDYDYLVKESFGRRLSPTAPDSSLLLLKAVNALPHGGGQRISENSDEYRMLRRWISQAMPYGEPGDPVITGLRVYPEHRDMMRDGSQQLAVVAQYSDGSMRDVTRAAQYEPNDKGMAEVAGNGSVKMLGSPGDVAVMVRYQGQVSTFRATVPMGIAITQLPPVHNRVDEMVFTKLKELGLPPSDLCDDAAFLRRVTIDLAGRLPTADEARAFTGDTSGGKRDRCVERLLAGDDYADYFADYWSGVLRNKREKPSYRRGTYAFHGWIRSALRDNMPYDKFVRNIVGAVGELETNPPVVWYRQVDQAAEQVEDTSQLFLGTRLQCARCHHHPFEKWSQQDYYGMQAFFSRVGRKDTPEHEQVRVYHKRGEAAAVNPKNGKSIKPTVLGGEPLALGVDEDPRLVLADWMATPTNPFFAQALVNRYWKHFFGRGLVEPEDDMRQTNPPTNPKLLAALSDEFVKSGFDLKQLCRTICTSSTYQLSAEPNAWNAADKQNFSRYYPRRLQAEVLLDGIDQVLGTHTELSGLPDGARAVQIPDMGGASVYFLNVFGRPAGSSACACERMDDPSLAQSLHLLNSSEIYNKLAASDARRMMADASMTDPQRITEFYYRAFGRPPTESEIGLATSHLAKADKDHKAEAWEDVLWAVINTKEFLFNH